MRRAFFHLDRPFAMCISTSIYLRDLHNYVGTAVRFRVHVSLLGVKVSVIHYARSGCNVSSLRMVST